MVVYKNKNFVTRCDAPNVDFMGNADYVIPDDSAAAEKIISMFPNFRIIENDNGGIADIAAAEPALVESVPEPPTNAELAAAIAELAEVMYGG